MASPKFACTWLAVAVVLVWSSAVTSGRQDTATADNEPQVYPEVHNMQGVGAYQKVLTVQQPDGCNCNLIV
jgi:hypothetical protein